MATNKKYEITDIEHPTRKGLYRIRALRDFSLVKTGDLGGYIQHKGNLSHHGAAWIFNDAIVYGNARIYDDAWVHGNARIYDDAKIQKTTHYLAITPIASENCHATCYRTATGHWIRIGCWKGTVTELRDLIDSNEWPSKCDAATRNLYRPKLSAYANLCQTYIDQWEQERNQD